MNVVDSSGWLEYFANSSNAAFFTPILEDVEHLVVPVISMYEVFRHMHRHYNRNAALEAAAMMRKGRVISLTDNLSITAALLGLKYKLAVGDSIILATAQEHEATLWTQDADFMRIPGVKYKLKK